MGMCKYRRTWSSRSLPRTHVILPIYAVMLFHHELASADLAMRLAWRLSREHRFNVCSGWRIHVAHALAETSRALVTQFEICLSAASGFVYPDTLGFKQKSTATVFEARTYVYILSTHRQIGRASCRERV